MKKPGFSEKARLLARIPANQPKTSEVAAAPTRTQFRVQGQVQPGCGDFRSLSVVLA
jgi:hypothetical protein